MGFCPICEQGSVFTSLSNWYRDDLICNRCLSIPRERAVAKVLKGLRPNWRELKIHEAGGVDRGFHSQLMKEWHDFIRSHFYPGSQENSINGIYNIDLERQLAFSDREFDVILALDILEHVFEPKLVLNEMRRTLKADGVAILTFPIQKQLVQATTQRAERDEQGNIVYLQAPEFHGNPIDDRGSLVTYDYGYEIHQLIHEWTDFEVQVIRFCDSNSGIIGEFTEIILLKPNT